MKKVLIVYDTKFGNTARLAEIAPGVRETADVHCKARSIKAFTGDDIKDSDAVLLGCPVYALRATRGIKGAVGAAKRAGMDGKTVSVFETYMGSHRGKALCNLESWQKKVGDVTLVSPGDSPSVLSYVRYLSLTR